MFVTQHLKILVVNGTQLQNISNLRGRKNAIYISDWFLICNSNIKLHIRYKKVYSEID